MNIIVVGLSHNTAPVELRERLAVPESRMGEALTRLVSYSCVKEGMFLSTCNRVEVYAVVSDREVGFTQVQDFLVSTHFSLSADELFPHVYRYADDSTIKHLFRVASSLDSMILGEPQVLGQVKDAFELTLAHRTSGVILNKFVKKAISVGKAVRTQTRIAEYAVSVSYAGVELAKKIFSSLKDQTVLLVGAGEMGKLAARHLVNSGVKQILVTTRNTHRATNLAEQFNGKVIPFEDFRSALPKADIVICATGAPYYVISTEDIQSAIRQRMNRPMFLIDISVPRNIDPAGKDVDNAFVFDIDDLKSHVGQNQEERRKEANKAEMLVKDEVDVMLSWIRGLEATPTIVALRKRAEEIKRSEVDKVLSRLEHISSKDQDAIEGLASAIVNKLLHGSLVTLKSEAQSKNGFAFIEAARRFFDLAEPGRPEGHSRHILNSNVVNIDDLRTDEPSSSARSVLEDDERKVQEHES
ncbi:MAG: glutamyl-tRNA reductase [Nitrospirales bacterium]